MGVIFSIVYCAREGEDCQSCLLLSLHTLSDTVNMASDSNDHDTHTVHMYSCLLVNNIHIYQTQLSCYKVLSLLILHPATKGFVLSLNIQSDMGLHQPAAL